MNDFIFVTKIFQVSGEVIKLGMARFTQIIFFKVNILGFPYGREVTHHQHSHMFAQIFFFRKSTK